MNGSPKSALSAALLAGWVGAAVLVFTACAFPTRPGSMAPLGPDVARDFSEAPTVNVQTLGGQVTFPWYKPKISNDAFSQAAMLALARSGVLLPVIDKAADYQLELTIAGLEQPTWHVHTGVSLVVAWKLWRTGSDDVHWQDVIRTRFLTPFQSDLIAQQRLRIATEGAARENIREAISELERRDL